MGELSNTTINGVSYDFKDAGAARQSHSHTKSQITDFPTSMPASDVSAWAKASTKPTYTASEVGAVPNTAAGVSAAINQLTTGDSAPTDNDYYVSQYAGGGTSTTTYHRRPVSKLWDYIKSKLASKGSATQPVYFSNGVPVATTYTLGKSVPSDAKFTDTTYSAATTSAAGLMSAADKTKLNGIATGAQVNSITGVKGNAESSYRTGNVNLTPANIGAAPSSLTVMGAGLDEYNDIWLDLPSLPVMVDDQSGYPLGNFLDTTKVPIANANAGTVTASQSYACCINHIVSVHVCVTVSSKIGVGQELTLANLSSHFVPYGNNYNFYPLTIAFYSGTPIAGVQCYMRGDKPYIYVKPLQAEIPANTVLYINGTYITEGGGLYPPFPT